MDDLKCITCNSSLRDTGKVSPDLKFAYCTVCNAKYVVVPAIKEDGQPYKDANGNVRLYLDPLEPGYETAENSYPGSSFSGGIPQTKPDFSNVKKLIDTCKSVKEFLSFLKKE